jgi:hypothetical protein
MFRFDRLTAFGKFKCKFKYTLARGSRAGGYTST